jgi:hypothetical protein
MNVILRVSLRPKMSSSFEPWHGLCQDWHSFRPAAPDESDVGDVPASGQQLVPLLDMRLISTDGQLERPTSVADRP